MTELLNSDKAQGKDPGAVSEEVAGTSQAPQAPQTPRRPRAQRQKPQQSPQQAEAQTGAVPQAGTTAPQTAAAPSTSATIPPVTIPPGVPLTADNAPPVVEGPRSGAAAQQIPPLTAEQIRDRERIEREEQQTGGVLATHEHGETTKEESPGV